MKIGKNNGLTEIYHYPEGPGPQDYPASEVRNRTKRNFDFAPLDISDDEMPDGKVAAFAADFLSKKHEKPFFLGVGMFRPHIEWYVPRKYFNMYPPESLSLPPYLENDLEDVPEPPLNPRHIIPVPPPTVPSSTGPDFAHAERRSTSICCRISNIL